MRNRRAVGRARSGLCLLLGVAVLAGCAPFRGGWNVSALEDRVPELAAVGAARLGDLPPHFLPQRDQLILFLCRWPTPSVVPVSLPDDATDAERRVLRGALAAWAGAGLGLSFEERAHAKDGIEIDFALEGSGAGVPGGTGDTIADCRIAATGAPQRLDAQLRYASVLLRRSNTDMLDRRVPLSADQLMGAALHELGHALGFSGHVAPGSSVMTSTTGAVRDAGRKVNAGQPFEDATLRALYAVPSGSVVGSEPLAPDTVAMFEGLAGLAAGNELDGPWTRVGDRSARLFWRDPPGVPYSLRVLGWPAALDRPRQIVFQANPPAQLLMQLGHLPAGAR